MANLDFYCQSWQQSLPYSADLQQPSLGVHGMLPVPLLRLRVAINMTLLCMLPVLLLHLTVPM